MVVGPALSRYGVPSPCCHPQLLKLGRVTGCSILAAKLAIVVEQKHQDLEIRRIARVYLVESLEGRVSAAVIELRYRVDVAKPNVFRPELVRAGQVLSRFCMTAQTNQREAQGVLDCGSVSSTFERIAEHGLSIAIAAGASVEVGEVDVACSERRIDIDGLAKYRLRFFRIAFDRR